MRTIVALLALASLATLLLPSPSTARASLEPEFTVEVGRLNGVSAPGDLEDPDLALARAIVDLTPGNPLPALKNLTAALIAEFGSAELLKDDFIYIWELDPETGEWIKLCIERDTIVVAPDESPNPIVVSLVTRVVLD